MTAIVSAVKRNGSGTMGARAISRATGIACRLIIHACMTLAALLAFSTAALATPVGPPQIFQTIDANGVDLSRGSFNFNYSGVSIGPSGAGGLAFSYIYDSSVGWRHNYIGSLNAVGSTYTASIGDSSETFTLASGVFTSVQQNGSTLTY